LTPSKTSSVHAVYRLVISMSFDALPNEVLLPVLSLLEDDLLAMTVAPFVCTLWRYLLLCRKQQPKRTINNRVLHNRKVMLTAVRSGSASMVEWLHLQGCPWSIRVCPQAAKRGYTHILYIAMSYGCPVNVSVCSRAAKMGHFDTLKWLVRNRCPITSDTCANAAKGGQLAILKWLRKEHNAPWSEMTCYEAARGGHLKVLKWAVKNGANGMGGLALWPPATATCTC